MNCESLSILRYSAIAIQHLALKENSRWTKIFT